MLVLPLQLFLDDLQCTLMILTPSPNIFKTHSIPKSKLRKILVENTTIIAREINKLWLQILEALQIKIIKKQESIELILKIARMFWNAFSFLVFLNNILYSFIIFYSRW